MSIAQVDHVVLSVVLARRTMDIDGNTMVQSPHFLEILNVLIPTLTSTVTLTLGPYGIAWYSWIGHGLQSGPTLAFSLWQSDFKTKTSFGFLVKEIRGRFFSFFRKVEK